MAEVETGLRIKEKAHELFMQYGLRSVSMDDIATHLGISKKTIYQFYADKDELVEAVIDGELSNSKTLCERDQDKADNAIHEIFLAMDMVVEILGAMNPSLVYDMHKYHPKAFLKFQQHKHEYLFNVIRQNIDRGVKEGFYRADINVDILSRYRVEGIMLPFSPDFQTRLKHSMVKVQEEITLHFVYGLASAAGYKLISKYQQERLKLSK